MKSHVLFSQSYQEANLEIQDPSTSGHGSGLVWSGMHSFRRKAVNSHYIV